jgi:Tol biopolymer transport system component
MAQRFDLASLATRGNPVPMVENVEFYNPRDLGDFAVSQEGSLIYRPTSFSQSRFAWMRFPSKEIEEFGDPFAVWTGQSGALSRDGKKVAFSKMNESSPDSDLWVLDTTRNTLTKAMARNTGAVSFAFSPDGDKIVTAIVGKADVIIHSLTNGTDQKITASRDGYATVDEWSPDGNYLMLNLQDPKTSFDIYAFPVDGSKPLPLLTQSYDEAGGRVSPNGKWMAYSSNESGRNELYVTNFPAVSSKIQVSTEGVFWYTWSRDGKKLYFSHGDGLFSAEMPSPDKLEFGKVENIGTMNGASPIDFAPDGRLLIVKSRTESALEPFRLILNVPAALRQ